MSAHGVQLSFLYCRAGACSRRYKQHRFNKTAFFLSIFKQYFSGKIEDSGVSRVVEGADPYRLCHVRIDALEAKDSSSVKPTYSASLRGKFALQTLRLPPSPTGEGSVCAKLLDRFSVSLFANFGHCLTKLILPYVCPQTSAKFFIVGRGLAPAVTSNIDLIKQLFLVNNLSNTFQQNRGQNRGLGGFSGRRGRRPLPVVPCPH